MLTSIEFIDFVLGEPAKPARGRPAPSHSALPEGFDGFDVEEEAAPKTQRGVSSFARQLLLATRFFGQPEDVSRESVIRSGDAVARHLPERASYWPKTAERPYQTLLFEASISSTELLKIPAFRSTELRHLNDLEAALARLVSEALDGFQKGGEGVTADVRKGRKDETLCIISILDEREERPVRLVCFGTWNKRPDGGLETFQITEQTRLWDPQLAREHLGLLYERQFKKLAGVDWQDAFTTSKEREQAEQLLTVCTKRSSTSNDILEASRGLLDTIAGSFGLRRRPKAKWVLDGLALPADHDIGVGAGQSADAANPFGGMALCDERKRLLGYLIYPLKSKTAVAQLQAHLEQNNRFHNVLVVYPDGDDTVLQLWQGRKPLVGKLRKGHGHKDAAAVVNLLQRFFVVSKARVRNPAELAQELAYRARYVRSLALRQLSEEKQHGELRTLFAAFSDALLHDQTEEVFADAYAQTLTYGLLAARWLSKDHQREHESRFTRELAAQFLPATSPFLREFFRDILQAGHEGKLTWLLDDIAALLDRIDVDFVFRQAVDLHEALSTDPIIHFYEPFLAEYDADQRRDRGVYYTPDAVVRYMVALADRLLKQWAPGGQSLSSGAIRVVDPATGTGTFLREVLRYCAQQGTTADKLDGVLANLRGLEIMVAPYAICHLRLALTIKSLLTSERLDRTVRVHLADTLEPAVDPPPTLFKESAALAREAVAAKQVKDEKAWTLVIGNPPYKNNSDYTLAQIEERFPALLQSSREAAAAQVRNIRDDYAWFFAAADALTRGGGAICFVTSDSYLKKVSYRYCRREVTRRYRITRLTRLGSGVFVNVGPRIGFAIIAMVRRERPLRGAEAVEPIELVDISALADGMPARDHGSPRDPRLQWLVSSAVNDAAALETAGVKCAVVRPAEESDYRFIGDVANQRVRDLRMQIVAKKDSGFRSIFQRKWPGIITAFDCLLKADSDDVLAKRMRRFFEVAETARSSDIDALAAECGCDNDQRARLAYLCKEARGSSLRFEKKRIKPVFAGSIPEGHEWYPPLDYAHWVYYEPRIRIPRNANPGRNAGWGWMQQWRDAETHEVFPKLIFTTSTNRNYGFRAYVLTSGWYTKLHGAASQQYHYVMLTDPMQPARLGGGYNNLSGQGEALFSLFQRWGLNDEDLLHFIAAFYNSSHARGYVSREEDSMLPLPEIVVEDETAVKSIVASSRKLRELRAVAETRGARGQEPFPVIPIAKAFLRLKEAELGAAIEEERVRVDGFISEFVGSVDGGADD